MTKCRPIRSGDQMQCACGLAWDIGEDKPDCQPKVTQVVEQAELDLPCRYCDGSGYFYSEPDLGPCVCVNNGESNES